MNPNAARTDFVAHTKQEYDTTGRVTRVVAESKSAGVIGTVADLSYCYNTGSSAPTCGSTAANDRSKLQWERNNLTGVSTAYGYDQAGRLTSAAQSGGSSPVSWSYTYDSRGNRLTASVSGSPPSSQSLTFNPGNQVSTAGYTYDGTGNLTADPSGGYAYNGAQQMTSATIGGKTMQYKYAGASQVEVLQQQTPTNTYMLTYGRTNQVGPPSPGRCRHTPAESTCADTDEA